jgi:hypothetical protein
MLVYRLSTISFAMSLVRAIDSPTRHVTASSVAQSPGRDPALSSRIIPSPIWI